MAKGKRENGPRQQQRQTDQDTKDSDRNKQTRRGRDVQTDESRRWGKGRNIKTERDEDTQGNADRWGL